MIGLPVINVRCDNCRARTEIPLPPEGPGACYVPERPVLEGFMVESRGWFAERGKHFCCHECRMLWKYPNRAPASPIRRNIRKGKVSHE